MKLNGSKWILNGSKWIKMDQNGSKWIQMDQKMGQKWKDQDKKSF